MESNSEFEFTGKGCSVPKDVTIVRFHPTVIEVERVAFSNCKQLREVVFNDGLKIIAHAAFYNCKLLSSITIPSTVTKIGGDAFCGCKQFEGGNIS